MIIKWLCYVTCEITIGLDEEENPIFEIEDFLCGETLEANIIETYNLAFVDLQLEDGSIICGVDRSLFTILES